MLELQADCDNMYKCNDHLNDSHKLANKCYHIHYGTVSNPTAEKKITKQNDNECETCKRSLTFQTKSTLYQ